MKPVEDFKDDYERRVSCCIKVIFLAVAHVK